VSIILPIGVGLLGGLAINYISDVLPHTRRFSPPVCWNCSQHQTPGNYFLWPRKCPHCGKRRRLRVWLVDALTIAAAIWLWSAPPERLGFSVGFVLLIYFAIVVVIDVEHRLILHPVSMTGAVLSAGVGVWLHGVWPTMLGGLGGFGIMLAVYYFGAFLARWLARRRGEVFEDEALGFGDVNLAGVLGLLLGWPGIIAGLILAILLGGFASLIYVGVMILSKRFRTFAVIPYGPFLVLAAVALLYFRDLFSS
jgi:leader peptidase (prepilin peptidase)/N-methyltransferase